MVFLLLIAFVSGLVTIFAPCIWPLLPIVLSTSAGGGRKKALGITLGILLSFGILTLSISYLVSFLRFDSNILRIFAVLVILFLGLTLVIPALSQKLEGLVSRLSGRFGGGLATKNGGLTSGFIAGVALGVVWTPCAGPILATIATLAATRAVNFGIVSVTFFYILGIGIPLFLFMVLGQKIFAMSKIFNKYTGTVQKIFGAVMILTAILIYTNIDKLIEAKLLDLFPSYSSFLIRLETVGGVQNQLSKIKGGQGSTTQFSGTKLDVLGKAPDFVGISKWLNTDKNLTLSDLRGKVVLVDFWTYTCINCIRTLPFVTSWYAKYKDQGFVVIGVHTPEFEFEKNTQNVENAISQYKIHYPVAQDNDYKTWDNYGNQYWPAEYLIDASGNLRETHFGEGDYDKTEMNIKALLAEAGKSVDSSLINQTDQTPKVSILNPITLETYVGLKRMQNFGSNESQKAGLSSYTISPGLQQHYFGYNGNWNLTDEYAESGQNSHLILNFVAQKVFLVITPAEKGDKVKVMLDGKVIPQNLSGTDVNNGEIILDDPRLYNLVNLTKVENHILDLEFENPKVQVFAFTFG